MCKVETYRAPLAKKKKKRKEKKKRKKDIICGAGNHFPYQTTKGAGCTVLPTVVYSSKVARRKIKGHLVVLPHDVAQATIVLRWLLAGEHRLEARVEDADVVQPGLSRRGRGRRCRIWRLGRCGPHVHVVIAAVVRCRLLVEMRARVAFVIIEKFGVVFLLRGSLPSSSMCVWYGDG